MNGDWPQDTALVTYTNLLSLLKIVQILSISGHVFIVNPQSMQVAMSDEASRLIVGWDGGHLT